MKASLKTAATNGVTCAENAKPVLRRGLWFHLSANGLCDAFIQHGTPISDARYTLNSIRVACETIFLYLFAASTQSYPNTSSPNDSQLVSPGGIVEDLSF